MSNAADNAQNQVAEPLVLSQREGVITRITLNRPRAINALNLEMLRGIEEAVAAAVADGSRAIVLDGAGERGFCGGGDIKEISSGDSRAFLATEYRVDHAVAVAPIPVIGFMDGVTMGGGIGLTGHAKYRVVTERSRLAMPEVRIGIVPDVGGNLLLAQAPGHLGELLAATACDMTAGDAIALGFADFFVPSDQLEALAAALAHGEDPGVACARFAQEPPVSQLVDAREWWDAIVLRSLADVAKNPKGALLKLLAELEASDVPAAREAAEAIRGFCPVSVAVALAQVERTRRLDLPLAQVLADDLRVLGRIAEGPNFVEGVRAQIIDKDRNPQWIPATIEALDEVELARILDPAPAPGEVELTL